jgi:Rps23 Pro-64 3,4-dihydroxylase Tpa1-like proline 4-hydroxylase
MHIKNYIEVFDNVLNLNTVGKIVKFANTVDFKKAKILGNSKENIINTDVRKVNEYSLNIISNSLTNVHWYNFLYRTFLNKIHEYEKIKNLLDFPLDKINDIAILKYENSGFYTWHTDNSPYAPRTISCIFLLNDDYEGGNLCFRNPDGSDEWEIKVKANRLIIWPSNFLYQHTVKPVTKGIRYSVVAWAL